MRVQEGSGESGRVLEDLDTFRTIIEIKENAELDCKYKNKILL